MARKTELLPTQDKRLYSLKKRFDRARSIGGKAAVRRIVGSDEFADLLRHHLDAKGRLAALELATKAIDMAPDVVPPRLPGSHGTRIKVQWTDELIDRLRREAQWCLDNLMLARRLGFPDSYAELVRLARKRHCTPAHATQKPALKAPAVGGLSLAA